MGQKVSINQNIYGIVLKDLKLKTPKANIGTPMSPLKLVTIERKDQLIHQQTWNLKEIKCLDDTYCEASISHSTLPIVSNIITWHNGKINDNKFWHQNILYNVSDIANQTFRTVIQKFQQYDDARQQFLIFMKFGEEMLKKFTPQCEAYGLLFKLDVDKTEAIIFGIIEVLAAFSEFFEAADAIVVLTNTLFHPTKTKEPLDENKTRKIVYQEEQISLLNDFAWPLTKNLVFTALENYTITRFFKTNIQMYINVLNQAIVAGNEARRWILTTKVTADKMYARIIMYAKVATVVLLSLSSLVKISTEDTCHCYENLLKSQVTQFTAEITHLQNNVKNETDRFYLDVLESTKLQFKNKDKFILDVDDQCPYIVKRFSEFWNNL